MAMLTSAHGLTGNITELRSRVGITGFDTLFVCFLKNMLVFLFAGGSSN